MPEIVRKDGSIARTEGPARGYKWADATPGNALAVRHGAFSDRLVSQRAQELLAELLEQHPWLNNADGVVLDVLVRAKVRYDALDEYATDVIEGRRQAYPRKGYPSTGIEAVPDRVWQSLQRQENIIIQAAGKLGFSAADRASLYRDAGMAFHFGGESLTSLAGQGRKLRQLRGRG